MATKPKETAREKHDRLTAEFDHILEDIDAVIGPPIVTVCSEPEETEKEKRARRRSERNA